MLLRNIDIPYIDAMSIGKRVIIDTRTGGVNSRAVPGGGYLPTSVKSHARFAGIPASVMSCIPYQRRLLRNEIPCNRLSLQIRKLPQEFHNCPDAGR